MYRKPHQPGRSDNEPAQVCEAAGLLDITEYRLFELVFERWYGSQPDARWLERVFAGYLFRSRVPHLVRQLVREVRLGADSGTLDPVRYGIRVPSPSAAEQRRGRIFVAVFLCLGGLLFAMFYLAGLFPWLENCYFPPCY